MGWDAGPIDPHAEIPLAVQVDHTCRQTNIFNNLRARTALSKLRQPWVFKSTRFHDTFEKWRPLLEEAGGFLLVLVQRNPDAIMRSHERRNESMKLQTIIARQKAIENIYRAHQGPKINFSFEKLIDAIDKFDIKRARK
jgi:hypothetical protein